MSVSPARARRLARLKALRRLGYRDYGHYLRSPQWRSVKARYRASGLPQQCMCGSEDVQLHHKTYERVGAELLTDLTPLCANCHRMVHILERRGELGLDMAGFESADRAAAYRPAELARRERVQAEFAEGNVKAETRKVLSHLRTFCRSDGYGDASGRLLQELDATLMAASQPS